jgi:hypothetical protein
MDALESETGGGAGVEHATPEDIFMRTWAQRLFAEAAKNLQAEFQSGGRQAHYEIFLACLWAPVMEGAAPVSHAALGQRFELTEKEVSNRLITAKRGYERHLRQEIKRYALTETDVTAEIQELTRLLAAK